MNGGNKDRPGPGSFFEPQEEVRPECYAYPELAHVAAGVPCVDELAAEAGRRNARAVVVVVSNSLAQSGELTRALGEALGDRLAGIETSRSAEITAQNVLDVAGAVRPADPDMVVTIGGGGLVDTVKLVLLSLAEDIKSLAELERFRMPKAGGMAAILKSRAPGAAHIVVPTTLAGAHFTSFSDCLFPGEMEKSYFRPTATSAQALILDPWLAAATPLPLWLQSGIKAVDHAVESVCSIAPSAYVDAACLHGLRLLAPALRATYADTGNVAARHQGLLGHWLAGAGMGGRAPVGASHGFGHLLTAMAGVPHGLTSAVMLPAVLRYNAPVNAARQALIAEALGRPDLSAAEAVAELIADLGLPGRLRDAGVTGADLPKIAESAPGQFVIRNNPRPVKTPEDAMAILEDAW